MECENVVTDNFVLKTDAACTLDAALLIQKNEIAKRDMLVEFHLIFVFHACNAGAIRHGEILQGAFAALIADRTIERVTGQQELEHITRAATTCSVSVRTTMPSATRWVQAV